MVDAEQIKKDLEKIRTNSERLEYLKKIIIKIKDKELEKEIEELIKVYERAIELEEKSKSSKQKWSIPDEPKEFKEKEQRRLEQQVISFPLRNQPKDEEEVKYGLSHSDVTYEHHRMDYNPLRNRIMNSLKEENLSFNEDLPAISEQKHLIEERVRKYMPNASNEKIQSEVSSIGNQFHYEAKQQSGTYASLSEELHDKERKKHKL